MKIIIPNSKGILLIDNGVNRLIAGNLWKNANWLDHRYQKLNKFTSRTICFTDFLKGTTRSKRRCSGESCGKSSSSSSVLISGSRRGK